MRDWSNSTFWIAQDGCGLCARADEPAFDSTCKDCFGQTAGGASYDTCGICRVKSVSAAQLATECVLIYDL